jgi:FtsZ-interacting cell division protein ZipA
MNQTLLIALIVVGAVVIVLLVVGALRRRSRELKDRFGAEYDRLVREKGGRRSAEEELLSREERVKAFELKPLAEPDRRRFGDAWMAAQARFVDDPKGAVADANRLVKEVMLARGYPVSDFERRAADISVDHPHLIANYRAAHDIAMKSGRGTATTDELRAAVVHYRALFEELLREGEPASARRAS